MNALRKARAVIALSGAAALLTTAGTVVSVAVSQSANADPFSIRANGGLNIRSGPGLQHSIIGGLPSGARVDSTGPSQHGWMPIRYGNRTGWVSDVYLRAQGVGEKPGSGTPAAAGSAFTTAALNVRTGAGINYRVITVLAKGSSVQTTGTTANGYTEIRHNGASRWVSSQYLSGNKPSAPTPSAPGLPPIVGTATATAELMIRTTSGSNFVNIKDVPRGTVLQLTGVTENGRTQIVFEGAVRWVNSTYLSGTSSVGGGQVLPPVVGKRWATAALDIRTASSGGHTVTEVPKGTALDYTGVTQNGRSQIIWAGAVRWVTAQYLSTTAPAAGGAGTPGGTITLPGLKPNTARILADGQVRFPQIRNFGGVRPDSIPDHPSGRALDFMIPNYRTNTATGDAIAAWLQANAAKYNIDYVIWNQRIWSVARSKEGWRYMASRGSDTANHKDHVHVSVKS